MNIHLSRRELLALLTAGSLVPLSARVGAAPGHAFRIRTVTAGARLAHAADFTALGRAAEFLKASRSAYTAMGYEVQTLRLASQPLFDYFSDWQSPGSLSTIKELDAFARKNSMMLSLGPVNNANQHEEAFIDWVAGMIAGTSNVSCSLQVAAKGMRNQHDSFLAAARIMQRIAHATPGGEGNFRFVATAWCPPGTPFFPASYFEEEAFSIGLESADLLFETFRAGVGGAGVGRRLKAALESALLPIEAQAVKMAATASRPYLGIDTSPAPNLDVSIGRAIESLTGVPFGAPSTLSACAAITDVLKSLQLRSCGYSGLMLPILEDTTLAKRAAEQRYTVSDLLLYSSVCGTGLDVVPLPGDAPAGQLAGLIQDVAALAGKYEKPLSARLFPVPGKKAGDWVRFDNPYLTDAVVMDLG